MASPQYTFVTGCPNSGTTALAHVLNCHPDIALGFERFSGRVADKTLSPQLFEPERFRRFEKDDSHHRSYEGNPDREAVLTKISQAKIVGDKLPTLINSLELLESFKDVRLIVILREPGGVARSMDAKANLNANNFNAVRNYKTAVELFNSAVKEIVKIQNAGVPEMHVVLYEEFFFAQETVADVFQFLGVDPLLTKGLEKVFGKSENLKPLPRASEIDQYVAMNADYSSYRSAVNHARNTRLNNDFSRLENLK